MCTLIQDLVVYNQVLITFSLGRWVLAMLAAIHTEDRAGTWMNPFLNLFKMPFWKRLTEIRGVIWFLGFTLSVQHKVLLQVDFSVTLLMNRLELTDSILEIGPIFIFLLMTLAIWFALSFKPWCHQNYQCQILGYLAKPHTGFLDNSFLWCQTELV